MCPDNFDRRSALASGRYDGVPGKASVRMAELKDDLHIRRGTCHVLLAYDIGQGIALDLAERLTTDATQREVIRPSRRVSQAIQFKPPPLRITRGMPSIAIGRHATQPAVDMVLYDFGAVSVEYAIPLSGAMSNLIDLADALFENPALLEDARSRVQGLLSVVGPAIVRPEISGFFEDYFLYEIEEYELPSGERLAGWLDRRRAMIASLLRAERGTLSMQVCEDATSARVSYTDDDAAIIDWNAAVLIDKEPEDARAVFSYANVELLEMRHLDERLDDTLDTAFDAVNRAESRGIMNAVRGAVRGTELRRIAELQVDGALLFEGVNNALKLLGDQYLARVYQAAAQRMHLPEWDASILRKLGTLESIYDKLSDRQATRRMEILEWIIIVLIFVSIVLPFVWKGGH